MQKFTNPVTIMHNKLCNCALWLFSPINCGTLGKKQKKNQLLIKSNDVLVIIYNIAHVIQWALCVANMSELMTKNNCSVLQ